MSIKTTTTAKLEAVKSELGELLIVFEHNGGRGVAEAERIDYLTRRVDRLEAQLRREAKS
jgi:hypothetical protein